MRTLARIAAVSAGAAAVVGSIAPTASAADSFRVWTDGEITRQCHVVNEAGSAEFNPDGEHFYIRDHRSDGGGVRAAIYVNGSYRETLRNSKGSGSTVHYNRSYSESATVKITVYISTKGVHCGHDSESGPAGNG